MENTKVSFKVEAAATQPIKIKWVGGTIKEGEGFGLCKYGDEITVLYNGKKTSDYNVVFEGSNAPKVIKNKNGTFTLKSQKTAWYDFYIKIENAKVSFRVHCKKA